MSYKNQVFWVAMHVPSSIPIGKEVMIHNIVKSNIEYNFLHDDLGSKFSWLSVSISLVRGRIIIAPTVA